MVLVAHPRPESFNHAIASRVLAALGTTNLTIKFHDLYAEKFDPVLQASEAYTSGQSAESVLAVSQDQLIRQHREELSNATDLIAIHPNWWGMPPAILTGWIDRVLVPGVAYRLDEAGGEPEPLLQLQSMLVINTSDTPEAREREVFGDPLESIWGRCLAPYMGNPDFHRIVLRVVSDSSADERTQWLDEIETIVRSRFGR